MKITDLQPSRKAAAAWVLAGLLALPCAGEPLAVAFTRTYSPMETDKLYRGYLEHLAQCTGSALTNHFGQPLQGRLFVAETVPEPQIPALLQSNRLQAALVTSATAVWLEARGIAAPVAVRGQHTAQQPETFELLLLARADAGVGSLAQLQGLKAQGLKIGFPTERAAAGDGTGVPPLDGQLAMQALASAGLAAGRDYKAEHTAGHERALVGLQSGFWQAAFIASDQFDRMVKKREARVNDYRVLWRSARLPTESVVVAAAVPEATRARITRCTLSHRFTAEQARLFEGSDAFLPAATARYETYRQQLGAGAAR